MMQQNIETVLFNTILNNAINMLSKVDSKEDRLIIVEELEREIKENTNLKIGKHDIIKIITQQIYMTKNIEPSN